MPGPAAVPTHDFRQMDEARPTAEHWKILLISGMGFFTDAYGLFIIGVVMAILRARWHIGRLQDGLVESTALLTAALGALLFGRVADMVGHKRIYGVEVLVLAAGAIGCAFSPNIWWLIGLRFILGVGIGGDCPVSATIMAPALPGSLWTSPSTGNTVSSPLVLASLGAHHDLLKRHSCNWRSSPSLPCRAMPWLRSPWTDWDAK